MGCVVKDENEVGRDGHLEWDGYHSRLRFPRYRNVSGGLHGRRKVLHVPEVQTTRNSTHSD